MNDQVHTAQSVARLPKRLSIEMYDLKGAIVELKGVVMQCNATLDRAPTPPRIVAVLHDPSRR
jgi:hypothetical protein